MNNMFDVPDFYKVSISPYMEYARYIADERQKQKKNYKSSNPLSPNYEVVGVLGELVYQIQINEMFDHRLLVNGDDGFDFKNCVNVKSSEENKAKHLIEYLDKSIPNIYVFVKINLELKYGYIYSWIFGSEFEKKHKVLNFGYGDRKAMELEEMRPYYTYIPLIQKATNELIHSQYIMNKYLELATDKFINYNKR
jgi:hypothetical protein